MVFIFVFPFNPLTAVSELQFSKLSMNRAAQLMATATVGKKTLNAEVLRHLPPGKHPMLAG